MTLDELRAAEAAKLLVISAPSPVNPTFKTGYWIEESQSLSNATVKTIVFSTFVFNATSQSDAAVNQLLKEAARIFGGFTDVAKSLPFSNNQPLIGSYACAFRYQLVSKPRYDYNGTYRKYQGTNPKILEYTKLYKGKGDLKEFPWINQDDKKLPNEYYLELFDKDITVSNENTIGEGGTHANPTNRTKSAYFGLSIGTELKRARVIVHEALHPVLDHTQVKPSNERPNPIYAIYQDFFTTIRSLITEKELQRKVSAKYIPEIHQYIRENKQGLKDKAIVIRENIMTTDELKTSLSGHSDYIFYLDGYIRYPEPYNVINEGTQIHVLQIKSIIEQIKL